MTEPTTKTEAGKIFSAIPEIMKELSAVGRDQTNREQNFKYRGIDDLYNALNPLMAKYGVFTAPEVLSAERKEKVSKSGAHGLHVFLRIRYTFFATDGSSFSVVTEGEGLDYGDKGSNKAESVAHKYALTQVFIVRTKDQADPDGQSPEKEERRGANPKGGALNKAPNPPPKPGLPPKDPKPNLDPNLATDAQRKRLFALMKEANVTEGNMKEAIMNSFKKKSTKELTKKEIQALFQDLEEMIPKKGSMTGTETPH